MPPEANDDIQKATETLRTLIARHGSIEVKGLIDLPIWGPQPEAREPADATPRNKDLAKALKTLRTLIARHGLTLVKEMVESLE
jgi:hypothetical protein